MVIIKLTGLDRNIFNIKQTCLTVRVRDKFPHISYATIRQNNCLYICIKTEFVYENLKNSIGIAHDKRITQKGLQP